MKGKTLGILSLLWSCHQLLGCGGSDSEGTVASSDKTLEFFNWWTSPGEVDAITALLDLYSSKYPHTKVTNTAVPTLPKAEEELRVRMLAGKPPDAFDTISGWDLWKWIAYNGKDDSDSKVEPVDSIAAENKLSSVIPKPLLDAVSYHGKVYAIPIGVHRFNTLFYNKKLFDDNGLSAPATLDDFYRVAEVFAAKGIVPVAFGTKDGHQVKGVVWDSLLLAKAGVDFRESYLAGNEDPADPRVIETLSEYAHVLDYANEDRDSLTWDGGAQMVLDGRAAMTIVGDFAKGFFLSKGWHSGVELGEVPVPGTADVFNYVMDAFCLPLGIANRQAAVNLLNLAATTEAQDTFNPLKGATPPRSDIDRSSYDQLSQATMQDLTQNRLTLATNLLVKDPAFITALNDAMKQFSIDKQVEPVVNVLKNRYDQLK